MDFEEREKQELRTTMLVTAIDSYQDQIAFLPRPPTSEEIISRAKIFEDYVTNGAK